MGALLASWLSMLQVNLDSVDEGMYVLEPSANFFFFQDTVGCKVLMLVDNWHMNFLYP
jgi:hypothetical protein